MRRYILDRKLPTMNTEQIISKFHERGLSATPQRLAICEYVLSSKEHPTVDQAYKAVKKRHPTISLATIYQTLHLLVDLGLLQELGFGDGTSRFDPYVAPHVNIVCVKCGKIEDHESKSVSDFLSKMNAELGCVPVGQRLEIYTCCDRCVKEEKRERNDR